MGADPSSIWTKWNNENAIGSTGSRSTWFTCSSVIVATASSHSECMARMRRRSESRYRSVLIGSLLLAQLGLGEGEEVGGVGTGLDAERDAVDRPGEPERCFVVVDDRRQAVVPDVGAERA